MNFRFSDDQRLMQSALRELLDKQCDPAAVRAAWAASERGAGRVAGLWSRLADMGVLGVLAPERVGGMGGSMVDAVLLVEEAGRAGLPDALVDSAVVAVPLLDDAVVMRVVAGTATAAAVLPGRAFVYDADVLSDGARTEERRSAGDGALARATIDAGRWVVPSPWSPVASDALSAAFERGAVGSAAMLCGLADRLLSMTTEYAGQRQQFGKPIGSYQAVKHHLANVRLKLEFARPAVYRAALTLQPRDVSMALVLAADAGALAARVGLQVHGAIGYTWEHDLHLFMKPVWSWSSAYGSARWHRLRVAGELGLTPLLRA